MTKPLKEKRTYPTFAYTVVDADGLVKGEAWDNVHDMDSGAPFQVDLSGPYPRTVRAGQGLLVVGRTWCSICKKWAGKGHEKLHPEKYVTRVRLYPSPKQAMFWSEGKGWPIRLLKVRAPGYEVFGTYSADDMSVSSDSSKVKAIEVVCEVPLEEGLGKYTPRLSWLFQKASRPSWWTQSISEEEAKRLAKLHLERCGLPSRAVRIVKPRQGKSRKKYVEDSAYTAVRNRFYDQENEISPKRDTGLAATHSAHYIAWEALFEPEEPVEEPKRRAGVREDFPNMLLMRLHDCVWWCATSNKPCPYEPVLELARSGYTGFSVTTDEVKITYWPKERPAKRSRGVRTKKR